MFVVRRRESHTDRREKLALVLPPHFDLGFDAILVGVGQQINVAVVAEGDELAVLPIPDVVDVGQIDGQLPNSETGHEHLHGRRVLDGHERLRARRARAGHRHGRDIRILFFEILLDSLPLLVLQRPVVNQDFSDVAIEEAADVAGRPSLL